jgi:hypothetical protein
MIPLPTRGPRTKRLKIAAPVTGDRRFESIFLQRRVSKPSVPQRRTDGPCPTGNLLYLRVDDHNRAAFKEGSLFVTAVNVKIPGIPVPVAKNSG